MNIEFLLLAYAGIIVHYLMRWKEVVEKQTNAALNLYMELPSFLLSITVSTLLIYVEDDIKQLYPLTALTSIILGLSSQSIFNRVVTTRVASAYKKIDSEEDSSAE